MPAKLHATALVVLLLSVARVSADSFAPSTPEAFSSPSGNYVVRIEAADSVENAKYYWKSTEFNVFSYNKETEDYERVTKFDVEGHPLLLFINDAGTHIVTIDQHFGVGYGQIAAIYNFDGKRLGEWRLQDLFPDENLLLTPRFRRSTSSVYWRGDAGWSRGQKSVWIGAPTQFKFGDDGSYTKTRPANAESYVIELESLEMKRVPRKSKKAESGRRRVLTPAPHTTGHTDP